LEGGNQLRDGGVRGGEEERVCEGGARAGHGAWARKWGSVERNVRLLDPGSDAFGRRERDFWQLSLDELVSRMRSDVDEDGTWGESWGTASASPRNGFRKG
jgi:hypothetical protein